MANAFVAHAQTRLASAHLGEVGKQLSLPASNMAREEYAHAHVLYSAMLNATSNAPYSTRYSAARQVSVHKVAVGQRGRPLPLTLTAEDARVAALGVGV